MNFSTERQAKVSESITAFLLFGFPIQSFIPFFFNFNSTGFNFFVRAALLGIVIIGIIRNLRVQGIIKHTNMLLSFIIFWLIYGIRLIYDLEITRLRYLDTPPLFVYSFAFGVCFFPALYISVTSSNFNLDRFILKCFRLLFLSNICLLYAIFSFNGWDVFQILLSRANVNISIGGEDKSIVNPITIGFFGQVLSTLSIHLLNFSNLTHKYKFHLRISIVVGLVSLIVGASRGPMIFFVFLFVIELFLVYRTLRNKAVFISKVFIGVLGLILSIGLILNTEVAGDIAIVNRISSMYEARQNDEKEERDYEWQAAWSQFTNSPVVGDAFVNDYDQSYPHNLFLDVLMSTGLLGMTFFVLYFYKIFNNLIKNIHHTQLSFFVMIFLSFFLSSILSGGIFTSGGLWMSSCLVLGVSNYTYQK